MLIGGRHNSSILGKLSMVLQTVCEILYPPECPVCQKLLTADEKGQIHVHQSCYRRLKRIKSPMCMKCGKPVISRQQEYCFDCMHQKRSFESGHGLWLYDACSSASIFAYKYNRKREYALFYAQSLLHFYGEWIRSLRVQQIIPVPISVQKLRERGFNQAGLLAEHLGEKLEIPVNTHGLVRIHGTTPQKELGKIERRQNLEKAFRAGEGLGGIRRVLLVDDIYTTGSTIEYCTRALQAAGVEKVWFITLCIGGPF